MKRGVVRIIAGKWRGRQINIPDVVDLRPTPDRVRETLFNWLALHIPHSRCLDLFAGSGILGMEALSRGASLVTFVDASQTVHAHLQKTLTTLADANWQLVHGNIPAQLKKPTDPFNLVFIDPPYQANLLLPTCAYLEQHGFLAEGALIYLEANIALTETQLPANWRLVKQKKAGNVYYHLAKRTTYDN